LAKQLPESKKFVNSKCRFTLAEKMSVEAVFFIERVIIMNKKSNFRELLEWIVVLVIAVFAALLLRTYVVEFLGIDGSTMMPTLMNGERILCLKVGEVNRGDIIVFSLPSDPRRIFVKRVIGLPQERIEIVDGQVFINGTLIEEEYLGSYSMQQAMPETLIEDEHYFVMGDNRAVSLDSRDRVMGTIPRENIRGKAIGVYWPFNRIRSLQ
jgi:signal peptidase I